MNKVSGTAVIILAMAIFVPTGFTNDAAATNANFAERKVREINAEGRRSCRALAGAGYRASIVGIIEASSRSGYANFRIKTCFPTLSQCRSFINNINREVGKIDQIRRSTCKPI